MTTFGSASALATHQRRRAAKVRKSLTGAMQSLVNDQKKEALRLTSGAVSSETLAKMGHPYGRRRGGAGRRGKQRGSLARLPINRQSGGLQKSLRVFRRKSAQGVTWRLQFTSPSAAVLTPGGTAKMVARGFWRALKAYYNSRAKTKMRIAWRMAHK